jgi:hypothetical protein
MNRNEISWWQCTSSPRLNQIVRVGLLDSFVMHFLGQKIYVNSVTGERKYFRRDPVERDFLARGITPRERFSNETRQRFSREIIR